jgi:hypothetical protein
MFKKTIPMPLTIDLKFYAAKLREMRLLLDSMRIPKKPQ